MKEENPGLLYRFERYLEGEERVGPERVDRLLWCFPIQPRAFHTFFRLLASILPMSSLLSIA
jgi:hypothetical protein